MRSSSPKLKKPGSQATKGSQGYRPGITEEEKAARHRKAQRDYRARAPHLREKQRIHAAEKRAAMKAHRCRCNPPKPPKNAITIEDQGKSDSLPPSELQFPDFRASSDLSFPTLARDASEEPIIGSVASPTPEERIACDALADLANGGRCTDAASYSADSKSSTVLSSPLSTCMAFSNTKVSTPRLPPGVAPLTRRQVISVRNTGTVGHLTHVQSAQMRVALINCSPPLPTTQEQRSQWAEPPPSGVDRAEAMDDGRFAALYDWRYRVAQLFCKEDGYGPGSEDDFILPGSSP
ncbi:hypothetical protein C8F04DRAFT_1270540 [Mycena alexandri]|uniref:Uncharacterized protein n=1 Tax=Mycena alexandri TaxID=1745969 RepID=A0AAD6SAE2_9AGAR|nr:hypothetical protein C8F04DRAFT_1270540 [Mycena alexandri]